MAILIKRFKVRYNGVTYGPGEPGGEILYGLSQDEEDKLIAESNGTIERYIEPQFDQEAESPKPGPKPKAKRSNASRKKGGK